MVCGEGQLPERQMKMPKRSYAKESAEVLESAASFGSRNVHLRPVPALITVILSIIIIIIVVVVVVAFVAVAVIRTKLQVVAYLRTIVIQIIAANIVDVDKQRVVIDAIQAKKFCSRTFTVRDSGIICSAVGAILLLLLLFLLLIANLVQNIALSIIFIVVFVIIIAQKA
ncbi:hypothetical protein ElyMa_002533300 [Elysia marginata]|uniref:ABC transmembrane type-1 domain-containing protein n=1 Tax=Elysia marginata TaxID=1093978 RepID=A0AAV4GTA5_9GAST|nr:hypothetical protein ElyMa_002533300 [Elysia marginata]